MDQDSGRGAQRSAPSRDSRPRHQLDDTSPSGMPNPLPRRSAQEHMEPQLRRPRGSGTGTPFTAFAADDKVADDTAAAGAGDGEAGDEAGDAEPGTADGSADAAETSRPATFRRGARRGHRPGPPGVKPVK